MALLNEAGHGWGARKEHHYGDHQGHGRNKLSRHKQKAVNCGGPVRRNGHHPVDGGEGHHENVKNNPRASEHLETAAQRAISLVDVLLARPTIKNKHQGEPDHEIKKRAYVKAVSGQVTLLHGRQWLFSNFLRIKPSAIEIFHAKNDGKEKDGKKRERAGG